MHFRKQPFPFRVDIGKYSSIANIFTLRIVKNGIAARDVFTKTNFLADKTAIATVYVLGFMTALLLWAFGLVWLFFALASIIRCKKFPFNIGWWGFTFPLGAYALATSQLGEEMDSTFFKVLGTVCLTHDAVDPANYTEKQFC